MKIFITKIIESDLSESISELPLFILEEYKHHTMQLFSNTHSNQLFHRIWIILAITLLLVSKLKVYAKT